MQSTHPLYFQKLKILQNFRRHHVQLIFAPRNMQTTSKMHRFVHEIVCTTRRDSVPFSLVFN